MWTTFEASSRAMIWAAMALRRFGFSLAIEGMRMSSISTTRTAIFKGSVGSSGGLFSVVDTAKTVPSAKVYVNRYSLAVNR